MGTYTRREAEQVTFASIGRDPGAETWQKREAVGGEVSV